MTARTLDLDRYLLDDEPARWAARCIAHFAAEVAPPEYGSCEWLTADWRTQIASAVRAGECYRREALFLAQRLEDELAAQRWLDDVEDAAGFGEVARRVRDLARQPSHAELVARRAA